jgi:hypothetical protein
MAFELNVGRSDLSGKITSCVMTETRSCDVSNHWGLSPLVTM